MSPWEAVVVSAIAGGIVAGALTALSQLGAPRPSKDEPADRSEALARAREQRASRSRGLGALLLTLSVLIWPLGVLTSAAFQHAGYNIQITPFVMGGSAALFIRGRQLRAKDAESVLSVDKRPPVVYLRPFAVDQVNRTVGDYDLPKETEEQRMERALRHIAPLVALGDPTEVLPGLGALRDHVADSEWKQRVAHWTSLGGTILLHAGDSEGLAWEVRHVVSLGQPERIIIWRGKTADYAAFRQRFGNVFPAGLLEDPGARRQLLTFDADWTPRTFDEHSSNEALPGSHGDKRWQVLRQLEAEFNGGPFKRPRRTVRRLRARTGSEPRPQVVRGLAVTIGLLLLAALFRIA